MGRITSSGCARNDRITRDFVSSRVIRSFLEVSCDPVVPGAPTRRDPTHRIKLLSSRVIRSFLTHPLDVILPIGSSYFRLVWSGRSWRTHSTWSYPSDQVTFVSCDPVVPGAPTRRDPTHRIKLLSSRVIRSFLAHPLDVIRPIGSSY